MPRTRVGESANTATAARVCAVSEMSAMSTSMPCSVPVPLTVIRSAVALDPGTHLLEQVGEPHVALQARRAEAFDGDPAAGDGGGGEQSTTRRWRRARSRSRVGR